MPGPWGVLDKYLPSVVIYTQYSFCVRCLSGTPVHTTIVVSIAVPILQMRQKAPISFYFFTVCILIYEIKGSKDGNSTFTD